MTGMGNQPRFMILLATLMLVDAVTLEVLTTAIEASTLVDRLASLVAGFAAAWLVARALPSPAGRRYPPGFWPLVIVGVLLSYGIFAALAARAPHVQPLAHLAVSWLGALLFCGFGFWRIRRFRRDG